MAPTLVELLEPGEMPRTRLRLTADVGAGQESFLSIESRKVVTVPNEKPVDRGLPRIPALVDLKVVKVADNGDRHCEFVMGVVPVDAAPFATGTLIVSDRGIA